MFLGETKLLTLGFRKKGDIFVFERDFWNSNTRRTVRKTVAEVKLNHKGKVISSRGVPKDSRGNLVLFQSPKLRG